MYGLTTTDEWAHGLCVVNLNRRIGRIIDADMLERIYRTEGYLSALEAMTDMLTKPLLVNVANSAHLFRGERQ